MRKSRLIAAVTAAFTTLSLAVALQSHAQAATPNAGSISDTSPSVTWTGGPFAVPNTTGTALGQPDCSAPQSCDDFTLTVDTPAGYGTDHDLVITTQWPNTAADFDAYLLDGTGAVVASAASSADPEVIMAAPTSGTYTVRIVPFTPLGDSYTATAALKAKPAGSGGGSTGGTPAAFTNYAAPATMAGANDAGEPSIGTNWKSGATMYEAGLHTLKLTFDDSTSPAAGTWTDVTAGAANGCPVGNTVSLDPILWTDHQTGRTLESQLSGVDSLTCTTDNDGASWAPSMGGGIPSGVDHQTLGGGPFSANGIGALPGGYPNAVYYCSQDIATALCAVSRDGGTTFGPGVPTYNLQQCGGLHGHIKVGPDGTAYLPNKGCGNNQAAVVSPDNGVTWNVSPVPGTTPGDSDPSIGVGANNTVYFGYVGADGKPGVAVSHDHGATWSKPSTVGTEFGIQNAVFPTVVAGDDDRAAIAFIGTPTGGNYQDQANFFGVWHLYVATTYDGGQTWSTADATPNDPVQRGTICTGGTTCGNDRNLLDFIDMTIDKQGRVEVGYADGCINTCVSTPSENAQNGPADAQAAYATVARQSGGKGLFAAYDPAVTNVTATSVAASTNALGQLVSTVVVKNTGNQAIKGLQVQVLDNRKQVGMLTIDLPVGASKTVAVTSKATGGSHTITAVADPANVIAESNESDNKAITTWNSR